MLLLCAEVDATYAAVMTCFVLVSGCLKWRSMACLQNSAFLLTCGCRFPACLYVKCAQHYDDYWRRQRLASSRSAAVLSEHAAHAEVQLVHHHSATQ
jgi:hypothetical protein